MNEAVRAKEFKCIECHRSIVRFSGYANDPDLCAACLMMPGWNSHPAIRVLIDPEHAAVWVDNPPEPGAKNG